jgi:phosphohistidine phosphatase SixA
MRQLMVVRHGHYGDDSRLSDRGRAQMGALAEKLRAIMSGALALILTSTATRARESAKILSSSLGVGCEEHEILWSDGSHPEDLRGTLELVRSHQDKVDVLILVTHQEYAEDFPPFFAREELRTPMRTGLIAKGEAWVVDCAQKTMTLVSPF